MCTARHVQKVVLIGFFSSVESDFKVCLFYLFVYLHCVYLIYFWIINFSVELEEDGKRTKRGGVDFVVIVVFYLILLKRLKCSIVIRLSACDIFNNHYSSCIYLWLKNANNVEYLTFHWHQWPQRFTVCVIYVSSLI